MKAYKHILLTGVCMLWFCFRVMPQLCPSNALAPVFVQDFGQGSSATSTTAAVAGTTNYTFGSVGTDGNYVLTPSFDVSGKSDWTKQGDHTGNTFGNMFLVNAGGNKSIFFKQRVSGLCSGSKFNFSAWLANANTSSTQGVCGSSLVYPKVIFNIKDTSGTVLATYTTGNLPLSPVNGPANWQQYGFQFSLPNGTTDLVLEMVDYYGGAAACGNDLALDDILFTACTPQVSISLSTSPAICSGTNTTISSSLTNSPFVDPAYQWQKSTDNGLTWTNTGTASTSAANLALNNVTVSDGAKYRILVGPNVASLTSSSCVSASAPISLTVYPSPSVSVSGTSHVCTGFPLSLFLTASGGTTPYTYTWSGPNGFSSTIANPTLPAVAITASGGYALALTDANNCAANNQVTLPVLQSPALTITNNSAVICAGSSVSIDAASSISGSNFSWTPSLLSGTAAGYLSGATSTAHTIGDQLTNSGTSSASVLYDIVTTTPDGCSTAGSATVTIQPTPTVAQAGPAQNVCAVTSVTLSGNAPTVGSGSWTYPAALSGVSFVNALSPVTTVNGLTTGNYRFVWNISNGVCAVSRDTVNITVSAATVAGSLSGSTTVCSGTNNGTLTLSGYTGAIVQWETSTDNGISWISVSSAANTFSYSNITSTTIVRALVQSGVCAALYSNSVTLTVDPATVAGNLSADATVCAAGNGGVISLSGYTGNILQWETSVDNGSTWSSTTNTGNTISYTNLSATTLYRAQVQNGVCGAAYSTITKITVNAATVAGTLSGTTTVCAGANSGTIDLSGNTGAVQQWESSVDNGNNWTMITATGSSYAFSNLGSNTQFRVLIKSGVCAPAYANSVTVNTNPLSVAGTLSADATVCAGANGGTLSLVGYTGNVLQWETSVDNGSSWSPTINTSSSWVYTNLSATTLFRTKVQSGVCAPLYSNITTITVDAATVAGSLSGTATVCAMINNGTIVLSGFTGTINHWEISTDNGNSWSNNVITTTTYSYSNLSTTTEFRSQVQNGVCAAQYSNAVVVTVNAASMAGTLSGDATVCAGANSGTISLAGYTGNILQWETSVDNGNSWSPATNTGSSFVYTNLSTTTLFRAQVQNGVCAAVNSNVATITVNAATVAGTLSGTASLCASSNSGNILLSGYTGSIQHWETSTDNGSSWTSNIVTTATYAYNNLSTTTQFRALIKSGICADQYTSPATISIDAESNAGTLSADATVCAAANGSALTLTGNIGAIQQWEISTDNGSSWSPVSNTTNNYTYHNLTVNTNYRALVKNGACSAVYSNIAAITVNAGTVAGTLSGTNTICAFANSGDIFLQGYTGDILGWESSTDGGVSWSGISSNANTYAYSNISASAQFRTLVQNGVCASLYSNIVSLTVDAATVPGTLAGGVTVCAGVNAGTLSLTGATGNILAWESSTDNGTTWSSSANTSNYLSFNNISSNTQYRVHVQNGVCNAGYSNIATVTVDAATVAGTLSGAATVCSGTNTGTISLTGYTGNIIRWETSVDNGNSWTNVSSTAANYTYQNLTTNTQMRALLQNGTCSALYTSAATVQTDAVTVPGLLTGDSLVCAGNNNGSFVLSGFTGNILHWETSADNGNSWTSVNTFATVYAYTNTSANMQVKALVQNGVCAARYSNNGNLQVSQPVTVSLAGPDQTLCHQLSTTLAANIPVSGIGTWKILSGDAGAVLSDSSSAATSISGLVPGVYTLAWNIGNHVCAASADTVTLTILPQLFNTIDTAQQILCNGQAFSINGQAATGGNGVYQYQWEKSIDRLQWISLTGATTTGFAATADSTIFMRRMVNSGVCATASDPVGITVHASIDNNTIAGDQRVCIGDAAQLIAGSLPVGGNGNYQYQWMQSTDSARSWTIAANIVKDMLPGSVSATTWFQRIITSGACNAAFSSTSNIVTVSAQPVAKAMITTGNLKGCSPFTIDSTIVSAVGYASRNSVYEWYVNDTLRGSGTAFSSFVLSQDSAVIKLKTKGFYGCGTDSTATTVSVYATPKVSFTLSDTTGCAPLNINIVNTTPDGGSFQYSWDLGSGTPVLNTSAAQNIVLPAGHNNTDTSYAIVVKAYQYCDTVRASKTVTVKAKAKAQLQAVMQNSCSPLNVVFSNLSAPNGLQYKLSFGDGNDSLVSLNGSYSHTYHAGLPTTFNAILQASNGCGTDTSMVAFSTTPNPVNTDLTIKDTVVCGSPYTMTMNNNTSAATSFRWDLGDGSAALTTSAPGAVNYTYSQPGVYLITNTISSACSDSIVYRKLTIHPAVKATAASITQGSCIGLPVAFRNLSDSSLSAQWRFSDGTIANTHNTSHTFAQAGTYTVTLKVWNTYNDITCSDSLQQPVSLVASLPGQFTLSDTAGKCLPFSLSVVNAGDSSSQTTWNWGDGSTGFGNNTNHLFTSNGAYKITMQAKQAGGCVYTDTAMIKVNAPSATLSYKGGAYCKQGNSIEFTPDASRADSIRWDFGDGATMTTAAQKVSHSYDRAGGFLPKVSLIGSNHCVVPVIASDSIYIDEINAGFKVAAINNCAFTNYRFTDTSHSFFAITSRQWTLNQKPQSISAANITNESEVQQVYTKAGDYEAGLQVSNRIGCTARLDARFNVLIYEYPKADITAVGEACLHSLLEVKSIINSQDSVIRRLWNLGNGTAATDSIVKVQYYADGNYLVKLTVGTVNNCYDSAVKQLSVHPLPTLTIDSKTACLGDSVVLKANGAISYIWADQNNNIICASCDVAKALPTKDAQYQVMGYNEFGCSNITTTTVRVIQPFKMSLSAADSMCEGSTKKLFANGADTYRWSAVPGLSSYTSAITYASPATTTIYQVIGQDAYHCFTDTASIKLVVGKPTPVNVGVDTTITAGVPIQLNTGNQSPDIRQWQWSGKADYSCVYCASPLVKVVDDEYLTVKATNLFGCVSTDTVFVKTFCSGSDVFIPNAFTPDGDGVNDILVPQGRGIKIMKSFRIFSRWGELVFEKTNFMPGDRSAGWDGKIRGKAAATDVYVYLCEAVCEKGTPYTFKGNVAIIK